MTTLRTAPPFLVSAILVYLTILLAFGTVASSLRARRARRDWQRRLGVGGGPARPAETTPLLTRLLQAVQGSVTLLGKSTPQRSEAELSRMRQTLLQAGYRGPRAPFVFFNLRFCLALALPGLFVVLRPSSMWLLPAAYTMLSIAVLGLVGFYAPGLWLHMQIQSRRRRITEGFPDALDLLVVCVEAGLGLDAAIHRVGEEMALSQKVLSEELRLVDLGLRMGQARQEALRSLALRTGLEDINSFVTLMIQTDRLGGAIAPALRVQADAMRTKRQQRAEEMAAKLPVKLLLPLIFFIFPSLFVVILGPAGVRIINTLAALGTR
jgi:tight adherence protein C